MRTRYPRRQIHITEQTADRTSPPRIDTPVSNPWYRITS
jgi:hypothetical protein